MMCVVRKRSVIGRGGKGLRWNVSRQLTEICKQGWMNDAYELLLEEWRVGLAEKEEETKNAARLEQQKVLEGTKLLDSAEGGAGMLHNITKPRPWRGGAQVIEHVFEDAQLLKRVEGKRQEWQEHWQVDTAEQVKDDHAVRATRFLTGQQASTRQAQELEQTALSLERSAEACGTFVVFLANVKQSGYWPVQASTRLFLPSHSEECHEWKTYCFIPHSHLMTGVVQSSSET